MSSDLRSPSSDEIVQQLRAALPSLRAEYDVANLSLFGSRATGHADSQSDVDVMVEFARAPGFFRFVALEDELTRLLGVKVDLVMRSALRPRIGRRALAEALPI